jgi:predicted HAD superfamily Cof-like phosphohydrolase
LRCKLILEEALEFVEAAGFEVNIAGTPVVRGNYDFIPVSAPDIVGMFDAVVDLNYVSYGAANALGLQVEPGHEEVHRSNMTKVSPDGTVQKNSSGKVIKPDTFSPADLAKVVVEQGYNLD